MCRDELVRPAQKIRTRLLFTPRAQINNEDTYSSEGHDFDYDLAHKGVDSETHNEDTLYSSEDVDCSSEDLEMCDFFTHTGPVEVCVTPELQQQLAAAYELLSPAQSAVPAVKEYTDAMHKAVEHLVARLTVSLHEEGLLSGAHITVQSSDNALSFIVTGHVQDEKMSLSVPNVSSLAQLCCQLCPGTEQNASIIAKEFRNSLENDCLSLLFQKHCWAPTNDSSSLWASRMLGKVQQLSQQSIDDNLMFWEQYAAFTGHPKHPMSKRKTGLTLLEVAKYSPEFAPRVHLKLLAVSVTLLNVFPSPEAWQTLCSKACPDAMDILRASVGLENANDYILMPVHPVNFPKMCELFRSQFENGQMILLKDEAEEATLATLPTLSLRTMHPVGATFQGYRIKLPVPVATTSLPRFVSPVEVRGSHILNDVFRQLSLPKQLVVQLEEFGAHLRFGEGEMHSSEEAQYCSFLLRQSPGSVGDENCLHVPLSSMFCRQEGGAVLWEELWQQHQISDGRAWFESYVLVVLRAQLSVFLRYGMALEAHQQNTCLEFTKEGYLNRLIYQELGGGTYWDEQRLETLPGIDFRDRVYEGDDILEPWGKCVNVLRHTMLESHLLPLARVATAHFKLPSQALSSVLVSCLHTFFEDDCAAQDVAKDQLSSSEYNSLFTPCIERLLRRGETKALLKMRLMQTKVEQYAPSTTNVQ